MFALLNQISQGNHEWNEGDTIPAIQKTGGVLEVDAIAILTTQIDAMQNMRKTHLSNMSLGQHPTQVNVV